MGNIFNEDFTDFLKQLYCNQVDYVLVGGYSVILHGYPRTTGDLDILVQRTPENYRKLEKAFFDFGMSVFDMTEDNFLNNNAIDVFTFGRQPVAIDILIRIKGASFESLFSNAVLFTVEDVPVRVIHVNQLIEIKKAAGRNKDLDDIEKLKRNK